MPAFHIRYSNIKMIQNYKTFLTFRDGNVKEWMGIKVISVNNNNSNYQLYLKISSYNPTYADFLTLNHVKNVKKMVNKQIIEVTDSCSLQVSKLRKFFKNISKSYQSPENFTHACCKCATKGKNTQCSALSLYSGLCLLELQFSS